MKLTNKYYENKINKSYKINIFLYVFLNSIHWSTKLNYNNTYFS